MSISLILILGLLISSVVTADLLQLVLAGLKWVWGLVVKAIVFIVSLFPEPSPPSVELLPEESTLTPASEPDWSKFFRMPESVRSGLRISWTVMVAGFVLFALWRVSSQIFGWLRRKLASMSGAEFEPLPGAFRADFLSLLKRLLFWLRGLRPPFWWRVKSTAVVPEVATVRHVYRQFLHWAAAGGYPRHMSQTPHEYRYALANLLPEAQEDLNLITQEYVAARYGTWLPTEDELHNLKQSWHRVRQRHLKRISSELAN